MFKLIMVLCFLLTVSQPVGGQVKGLIQDLRSDDPGVWREASFRLVHLGKTALPELDSLAKEADRNLKPRIVEIVEIMLVCVLEPKDVKGSENLWKICESEFEPGLKAGKKLAELPTYIYEYGLGPPGVEFENPDGPLELVDQLVRMGGAGVPAAAELLDNPSAVTRMYGVAVLLRLGAVSHYKRLQGLEASRDQLRIFGGCTSETTELGAYVSRQLSAFTKLRQLEDAPCVQVHAGYVNASKMDAALKLRLIEQLNAIPEVRRTASWQEFWSRSRDTFLAVVRGSTPDIKEGPR